MRGNQSCIDFEGIAAAALANAHSLLPELVPNGRFERDEYVTLNPSRADKNLGSFKINSRTGLWKDFAIQVTGNDIISWYAHACGLKQGEAARQIAERLAVSTHKGNGSTSHSTEATPKIFSWGEPGPPVGRDEIRRHSYPKNGTPRLKLKIKSRGVPKDKWTNCYRVFRDGVPVGWQWKKPEDHHETPYFGAVLDPKLIFWPEGEKDADTLDGLKLQVFTFGGVGDGLPDEVDHYLKPLTKSLLVIPIDNDAPGRKHAQEKATLAHSCGVEHIRIFDPQAAWPECPEGGDITEWFEKGGGARNKLLEIVGTLPDWQPSADDDASTADDNAVSSWDHPDLSLLDDRRGDLPAFPLDVLTTRWQDWSKNSAHGAGTAIDYVVVPLFGFASGLIGTARRLKASASWSQPFTLWTAQLGHSGAGKTPGMDVSQRTLSRVERNRRHLIGKLRRAHETKIENAKAANKHWKDRVKEAVEDGREAPEMPPEAEIPEAFEAPRLFVSNATVEKLAVLLQARPQGMLVIVDELAGLFLNLSRYSGGTDREFWLEAWNGNPYRVERISRPPVDLEHLLVGLVGGFQPDKLAKSFDGDADGIYARVLYSWPREAPYRPLTDTINEIDPELENVLTNLINVAEFEEGKLIIRDVTFTHDAREVLEQFRQLVHSKKDGLDGRAREWWVKTPAHVVRLAGTLAYLDWAIMVSVGATMPAPTTIEANFVASAVRLMVDYFWPHARAALRQIGLTERHAEARAVLRWLRAERKDQVSIEDVRRDALQQRLTAEATSVLIEALVRAGWLRKAQNPEKKLGRRAHRWLVNRLLWAAGDNSLVVTDDTTDNQTRPARRTEEILSVRCSEPISANPAIPATDLESASSNEEATWTV